MNEFNTSISSFKVQDNFPSASSLQIENIIKQIPPCLKGSMSLKETERLYELTNGIMLLLLNKISNIKNNRYL